MDALQRQLHEQGREIIDHAISEALAAESAKRIREPDLRIEVYGQPAPQGSKRAFAYQPKGGGKIRAGVIESSHDRVTTWRQDVKHAAGAVMGWGERPPLDGPLEVVMVFTLARPKSHYGTGRNAAVLKPGALLRPCKTPDCSKLARATEDALTGIAWVDDALVVEYARLAKVWAGEDPDALTMPGAVITIRQVP
jgi:crossover junction endodeoxyribonuclease RusA